MKPVEGLALGGRYRLVRRIAVGGMGEVWVAHDESLGRDVAAKVLREEFTGNQDFLSRLRTEARNNAALSHTNIAQMYDYGEQSGSGYLVMELIVGETMNDLLERERVLPLRRLLPLLSQTARGLHAAHVAGVVHRDVKPGNILLEHGRIVKITDFGVSLAANQVPMTATGMVMGTAQYLSPEQAMGRAATGASDLYALGIVAYESLVGHRPFTGSTPVDIAVAHVNEKVPPLPDTVPAPLAELVMQLLEKEPQRRPRSGASVARLLDDLGVRLVGTAGAAPDAAAEPDADVPPVRSAPAPAPMPPSTQNRARRMPPVPAPPPAAAPVWHPPSFPPTRSGSEQRSASGTARRPQSPSQRYSPGAHRAAPARAEATRGAARARASRRRGPVWLVPVVVGLLMVLVLAIILESCGGPDGGGQAAKALSTTVTVDTAAPMGTDVAEGARDGMISAADPVSRPGSVPTTGKDE